MTNIKLAAALVIAVVPFRVQAFPLAPAAPAATALGADIGPTSPKIDVISNHPPAGWAIKELDRRRKLKQQRDLQGEQKREQQINPIGNRCYQGSPNMLLPECGGH